MMGDSHNKFKELEEAAKFHNPPVKDIFTLQEALEIYLDDKEEMPSG